MKIDDGTASESEQATATRRVTVGIAESKIASGDAVLTTTGLSSCLGVAVYDRTAAVAGLVHVMLPSTDGRDGSNEAKFADSGIRQLVDDLEAEGGDRARMEAKIAGGGDMFGFSGSGPGIGVRNVEVGRRTLAEFDIPVVGEDVGGSHSRSLRLEVTTGELIVERTNRASITL